MDILIETSPTSNSQEPAELLCFQLALVLFLFARWGAFDKRRQYCCLRYACGVVQVYTWLWPMMLVLLYGRLVEGLLKLTYRLPVSVP